MAEKKLKPCPCCKESWLYASDDDYGSGYESKGYRVECQCGYAWRTVGWHKTQEEAINAWNGVIENLKTFSKKISKGSE